MYSYFIKSIKGKLGWAPLYVVCRTQRGTTVKINTGVMVPVDEWAKTKDKDKAKRNNKLEKFYGNHEDIRKELKGVEAIIKAKLASGETSGAVIGRCIREVAENRVNIELNRVNNARRERGAVVVEYFSDFVRGIKDGSIKPNGKRIAPNTIRTYSTALQWLRDYLGGEDFRFKDITKKKVCEFRAYIEERASASSAKEYLGKLRAVARYALTDLDADGYPANPNTMCLQLLRGENVERIRNVDVVLSDKEITALIELPLTGREAQARDLFEWQCFCGQRYSDVVRTAPDCFSFPIGCDYPVFSITSQKTGVEAVVPITDHRAQELLKQKNYQFAKLSACNYNQLIKQVCKKLSAVYKVQTMVRGKLTTVYPLKEEIATGLTASELAKERHYIELRQQDSNTLTMYDRALISYGDDYAREHGTFGTKHLYKRDPSDSKGRTALKYRYELVSSHTARRTFATNEFYNGLSAEQVASETGHASTTILNKVYNKTTRAWTARKIADKKLNKSTNNDNNTALAD